MDISKDMLVKLIDDFAKNGRLFTNERQFQLALAWALKERGFEVILEYLVDAEEKQYVDLLVKRPDSKDYAAVELKYTTKRHSDAVKRLEYVINENVTVPVYLQGAGDVRRYEFLRDVARQERLLTVGELRDLGGKVTKAFAVIMTNDSLPSKDGNGKAYSTVAIHDGHTVPANKELNLTLKNWTKPPVVLKHDYKCEWKSYDLTSATVTSVFKNGEVKTGKSYDDHKFEYMVLAVKA